MNCTFEELLHLYTLSKVYVSIRELKEAGLVKEFCDKVEKKVPTSDGYKDHWTMFDSYKATNNYFALANVRLEEDEIETFCIVRCNPPSNMIAHLIDDDVPPIDMESLLAE